jgi:restriction system protein
MTDVQLDEIRFELNQLVARFELHLLAKKRQSDVWDGYKGIGEYHSGQYECDYVSPYSKGANNVRSPILVFLQDWMANERISKEFDPVTAQLGYTPSRQTNKNLVALLRIHFELELNDIYVTNLFPFVKQGKESASIPFHDLRRAVEEYGLPQITILRPRLVICLGKDTFNAFRATRKLKRAKYTDTAITHPFEFQDSTICCQSHPGTQGKNMRNRKEPNQVGKDWKMMAQHFKENASLAGLSN